MRKTMSFLVGAVLGGLVGGTMAMLFAPASGVEVRAQFKERTDALAAEIRQAAATRRIELQDRLESLRAPRE
jgi:gas vesicle protein